MTDPHTTLVRHLIDTHHVPESEFPVSRTKAKEMHRDLRTDQCEQTPQPDTPLTAETDMRRRMRPSPAAVKYATAILAAQPHPDALAAVPMVFPGKTHGTWDIGQPVETIDKVILVGLNIPFSQEPPAGWADYGWARDTAEKIARDKLAGRDGTFGYATIRPDGTWAVFEGWAA